MRHKSSHRYKTSKPLGTLRPEQLLVLTLRFSDGLTIPEIAEVVNAPVDTIKSRLKSALSKIQGALKYQHMLENSDSLEPISPLDDLLLTGEYAAQVYHSLGTKYVEKGMIEAALREWHKAQKLKPDFLDAYLASAQQCIKMNQPKRAVETLEDAVEHVRSGELHLQLAELYYETDDLDSLFKHSDAAVELAPGNPNAHYVVGRAYYRQASLQDTWNSDCDLAAIPNRDYLAQIYSRSTHHFERALHIDSSFAPAIASLAIVNMFRGHTDRALKQAEEAAATAPVDAVVLSRAAWVCLKTSRFEEGIKLAQRSIAASPNNLAFAALGDMHVMRGELEQARSAYKQGVETSSFKREQAILLQNMAEIDILLSNTQAAVEHAEAAVRKDKSIPQSYSVLAKAQTQRGDTPHLIIKTLREGIKHHPDNAELHELLSQALLRRGDTYDALLAANKAVKLSPNAAGGYIARARVYIKLDKPTEAIADIQKALEIDPENQEALELLSELEIKTTQDE